HRCDRAQGCMARPGIRCAALRRLLSPSARNSDATLDHLAGGPAWTAAAQGRPGHRAAARLVVALALGCGARVCARENPTAANPVTGEAQAIKEGAALFRANCSPCHGPNA